MRYVGVFFETILSELRSHFQGKTGFKKIGSSFYQNCCQQLSREIIFYIASPGINTRLIFLFQVSNKKDEETDDTNTILDTRRKDMKSFKANPKAPKNMVSGNFVKIDMKHKNYIHGNKSKMTGAKYKRQEWKRKAAGKFGRKN